MYDEPMKNPIDSRMEAMRQFLDIENEIAELRAMQDRTAEQLEKARFRRRELTSALHEIIDGPADVPTTREVTR